MTGSDTASAGPPPPVRAPATAGTLVDGVDVLLLDLDGTVYVGGGPVDGAAATITACAAAGIRSVYVTNNASRRPAAIAEQLTDMDVPAGAEDVVTSAQAGARLLAGLVPAGTRTMVVGSEHLAEETSAAGLVPVPASGGLDAARSVGAVVQGFDPSLGWSDLAAAAWALAGDTTWVATNTDLTIPTAGGIAPGNGSLVQAVATAAGRRPHVAGKPERPLVDVAVERTGAEHPLLVGDRLDTDIEAGVRAGLPTLLVLTGVSGPVELLGVGPRGRPTYLAADLRGLLEPPLVAEPTGAGARCGGVDVALSGEGVRVSGDGDRVAGLWALATAWWSRVDAGAAVPDPQEAVDRVTSACRAGGDR